LQVARALLAKGADVELLRADGLTVLMWAARDGSDGTVRALLQAGADVNARRPSDGLTALLAACQEEGCTVVKALLHGGASVDLAQEDGTTPLMLAARNGDVALMQLLLQAGARLRDRLVESGQSALHMAVRNQHSAATSLLLQAGASHDEQDKEGATALSLAESSGNRDLHTLIVKVRDALRQREERLAEMGEDDE
jgi:ankyrin repeat protein